MKKFVLLFAAGLMLGGAVFAGEDGENGALGFGILTEGNKSGSVGAGNLRGSLFLDVGSQLAGAFYYGFEFQGDVKKLDQSSSSISVTDVTAYVYGSNAVIFITSTNYTATFTLWDLDFSPRGYISFDLGNKIQLLGFAGLNYNWQTLDYSLKEKNGATFTDPDGKSTTEYKTSEQVGDGYFSIVAGARLSVGAFYIDYTRFLDDASSQVSWNKYNKDRFGLGINLRY